ncbi:MAG TPA: hypothetical protein VHV08_04985, partial [Pirellulales bacterium]|nr:hypothetical protein [Pirellulales bacterium]
VAAAASDRGWSKLISAETLEDEIKAQQIKLAASVQNSAKFTGGEYRRARLHLGLLATLFAIDAEYDQPMRWQREAPGMRELAARAGFNCKVGTDASFRDAKHVSEELQTLVRGGSVELPASERSANWPSIVDRPLLMKRLEQSQQQTLLPYTANSGEFTRHASAIEHEAELVAALAEAIQAEGYESADDETYREYAASMQQHALTVRAASQRQNYEETRQAVGETGKACASCHEGFRS